MKIGTFVKISAALLSTAAAAVLGAIIYYNQALPNNYCVTSGSELTISGMIEAAPCCGTDVAAIADRSGVRRAELRLLGIIPIKTVSIREVDEPALIPCGEPFGIKMLTDGVIVVEVSGFETEEGYRSPAAEAGIRIGDVIKTINGRKITSNNDIGKIIAESGGEEMTVYLTREDKALALKVTPKLCGTDNTYRAGLWVRDSSAGIGTVTFYDPDTGVFAGLGHPVCDVDTGEIMPLSEGEAVEVTVNGVKKGVSGAPGELLGSFSSGGDIGTLELNCEDGLYGIMSSFCPRNNAVPLGMRQEIEVGDAYIYTTVEGCQPQRYKIVIEKVDLHDDVSGKNMIIRVTDEELLARTGGIVQGMSGSPIIQNGKLVGAVTHVFVNNPAKGYAIFADAMYERAKEVTELDSAA